MGAPVGSGSREPERTCVGCRGKAAKRDLMRVVRRPDGSVIVDPTGRAAGRGAYVHPNQDCARRAARAGALARALRASLEAAEAGRLMQDVVRTLGEDR